VQTCLFANPLPSNGYLCSLHSSCLEQIATICYNWQTEDGRECHTMGLYSDKEENVWHHAGRKMYSWKTETEMGDSVHQERGIVRAWRQIGKSGWTLWNNVRKHTGLSSQWWWWWWWL
jgi:hypothetical protein